jgi:hypothetical protein
MRLRDTAEAGSRGEVWGGSVDFAVSTAPYVFTFHLAMGVWLGCYNQHVVGWGLWQSAGLVGGLASATVDIVGQQQGGRF